MQPWELIYKYCHCAVVCGSHSSAQEREHGTVWNYSSWPHIDLPYTLHVQGWPMFPLQVQPCLPLTGPQCAGQPPIKREEADDRVDERLNALEAREAKRARETTVTTVQTLSRRLLENAHNDNSYFHSFLAGRLLLSLSSWATTAACQCSQIL